MRVDATTGTSFTISPAVAYKKCKHSVNKDKFPSLVIFSVCRGHQ